MGLASTTKRRCPMLLLVQLIVQVPAFAKDTVASRTTTVISAAESLPKDPSTLSLHPSYLHELVEDEQATVVVKVTLSEAQMQAASRESGGLQDVQWSIAAKSLHPEVAEVAKDNRLYLFNSSSMQFDNATRYYTMDSMITVKGLFLGKTGVRIRLIRADDWLDGDEDDWGVREERWEDQQRSDRRTLDVWVSRGGDSVRLTKMFVGTLMILIPLANVLMGCELDLNVVRDTIRRPTAPLIGFCTQFIIMPLLAYVIAQTVFVPHGEYSMALGLFITGCAPGGGASNFWTILLDGNVNLSVTMTFLSTLASLVMMPLWIWLLGKEFLVGFGDDAVIKVPYAKIGSSLATLIGPLLIGVAIAKFKPTWAAKARMVMRPFIIFVLIFLVVFGALSNLYMFRMLSLRPLIGGLLLPWAGFMFGCFASLITRRAPADVTAIAVETGIQNTGIAILLLKFSFPAPDSDISALLPVIVACFTPGPLLFMAAAHLAIKWIKQQREVSDVEKGGRSLGGSTTSSTTGPLPLLVAADTGMRGPVILQLPSHDNPSTGLILVEVPSGRDDRRA